MSERPIKKRRFFVDQDSTQDATFAPDPSLPDEIDALPETDAQDGPATASDPLPQQQAGSTQFDSSLFQAVIGDNVSPDTISALQRICGADVERAVNMFFDGSWQNHPLNSTSPTLSPRSACRQ